jgi:hypothetical protein
MQVIIIDQLGLNPAHGSGDLELELNKKKESFDVKPGPLN